MPAGDVIKISSPATREFWEIPVVFEDEHLLVVDKPTGLLTSPDRYELTRPSLISLLHAAIAEGKAFATLAADAKAKAILLPNFSLSSTNALTEVEEHISRSQFLQVALSMPVGEVSPFIPTMDGGMVLYIKEKQPIDEKKAAKELPEFLTQLRQTRQREAFEQWFNHEAPQALADTPVVRRQPEINQPGAAN